MAESHRKMIIVAYFQEEDLRNKFHHIHIIPTGDRVSKRKKCNMHSNLYIEADFSNEEMQVFSELSRLQKKDVHKKKNKVMKFKEKNIHFIDITNTKKMDFGSYLYLCVASFVKNNRV
jgi:hypothetical protein